MDDLERLAASVHGAYLAACKRLGWDVKPENAVSYGALSDAAKELDRVTVRAVLTELREPSERMVDAGYSAASRSLGIQATWQAMIDGILEGKE